MLKKEQKTIRTNPIRPRIERFVFEKTAQKGGNFFKTYTLILFLPTEHMDIYPIPF